MNQQKCQEWLKNRVKVPIVNPLTNRSITLNGPTYQKLDADCAQYLQVSPLTRPASVLTRPAAVSSSSTSSTAEPWNPFLSDLPALHTPAVALNLPIVTSKKLWSPFDEPETVTTPTTGKAYENAPQEIVIGLTESRDGIWVCGPPTFKYKSDMSKLGGRWNAMKKCWIFPAKNLDDILGFFASKTVKVHLPQDRPAPSIAAAAGTSLKAVSSTSSVEIPVSAAFAPALATPSFDTATATATATTTATAATSTKPKTISITTDGNDRIKICGSNTYGIKDWLKKELNASWDFTTKCWVILPIHKPKLITYVKSLGYSYTE